MQEKKKANSKTELLKFVKNLNKMQEKKKTNSKTELLKFVTILNKSNAIKSVIFIITGTLLAPVWFHTH